MAFTARWTREAATTFQSLQQAAERSLRLRKQQGRGKSSRAEGLFRQVEKTVRLLLTNPRHPGLQTHEFHSIEHPFVPGEKVFEAYVQNRTSCAYRLFWCYGPGQREITLIAITPHP